MVTYRRSCPRGWELKTCTGEPHSRRAHSHAEWSLGLVTGGSCLVGCEGRQRDVRAPALVWFSPETVHDCQPRQTSDWAFRMLYWPAAGAGGSWGVQDLSPDQARGWSNWFDGLEAGRPVPEAAFPWIGREPALPGDLSPGRAPSRATSRPDRAYKRFHGLAPREHRTILRLRAAQSLIREGWLPADAALEAGFYDQAQFTRLFRDVTGTTPGRYARS